MSKRNARIESHVTPEEKQHLCDLAKKANITTSELVRRLVTGASLPNPARFEAVKGIVKVNADLARLGNLLKLALDDKRVPSTKIETLIDDIIKDRTRLKEVLQGIQDHRKSQ